MGKLELNHNDITEIFKENLKIENLVKSIQSIFMNERFFKKINYKPYFQRNYVWDVEKASYFIESIILGTEIPPLVLFQSSKNNEVIDGRQRYETIERFINGGFALKEDGLKTLKSLSGKKYEDLEEEIKESFENTKIRILQCSVLNEPSLSEEKEDKIKKEIFRRYNSGITSLKKEEIERAQFIHDSISNGFQKKFQNDDLFLKQIGDLFLVARRKRMQKRDRINYLLTRIRMLITIENIPINSYANSKGTKSDIITAFYYSYIVDLDFEVIYNKFEKIVSILTNLQKLLTEYDSNLKDNVLFYECCYWVFSIILLKRTDINGSVIKEFAHDINNASNVSIFWPNIEEEFRNTEIIFNSVGSHYYKSVKNRYMILANYFNHKEGLDFGKYLKDTNAYNSIVENINNIQSKQYNDFKLNKTDPVSVTIYDIMSDMKKSKFLIRPNYQRSEVINKNKASYLMESILLGIKIPPIFVYKRDDKVKEVIDGQQRLLTFLGFMGESYINELGEKELSGKNQFKLTGLKILKDLIGEDYGTIDEKYVDKILDFPIDMVEIDAEKNPHFSSIDLFLRLNTKPYPINPNSFEMWNSYIDRDIILKIKDIANKYSGTLLRPKDTRMKNEELITTLACFNYFEKENDLKAMELINIYSRYNRICSRIKNKESITRILGRLNTVEEKSRFMYAIDAVLDFILKLQILVGEDFAGLNLLISTKTKANRTDENFYFLWLLISEFSERYIIQNRKAVLSFVSEQFAIIKNVPDNYEIDNFIQKLNKKSL